VNWLRASARFQRWNEEVILLKHEMEWTMEYFKRQQRRWKHWGENVQVEGPERAGLKSYAEKQASMWKGFMSQAKEIFDTCHTAHN